MRARGLPVAIGLIAVLLLVLGGRVDEPAERGSGTWQRVQPGGRTTCARGDPFSFWVRRGDPAKLVFYLQAGGGCFDYPSCRPGTTFFDDSVDESDDPARESGIFDLGNPANPFSGWTFVYVPSCTGDVHTGDAEAEYRSTDGREIAIQHRGFLNVSSALDWTLRNVTAPETVLVTGCSAGSVGSAVVAPYLIEAYPRARVVQLGDSLSFEYHRPLDLKDWGTLRNLAPWIPALKELGPGRRFSMTRYYAEVARWYPSAVFAQLNSASDVTQARYFEAVGGDPADYPATQARSLAAIATSASNFRYCTVGGSDHCFLPFDRFYRLAVDGVRVRDWVADLIDGDASTLRCQHCSQSEAAP